MEFRVTEIKHRLHRTGFRKELKSVARDSVCDPGQEIQCSCKPCSAVKWWETASKDLANRQRLRHLDHFIFMSVLQKENPAEFCTAGRSECRLAMPGCAVHPKLA